VAAAAAAPRPVQPPAAPRPQQRTEPQAAALAVLGWQPNTTSAVWRASIGYGYRHPAAMELASLQPDDGGGPFDDEGGAGPFDCCLSDGEGAR